MLHAPAVFENAADVGAEVERRAQATEGLACTFRERPEAPADLAQRAAHLLGRGGDVTEGGGQV